MSQPRTIPLLSVVVPCYNEEAVVAETVRRLVAFADSVRGLEVELIFVDDGSQDSTRSILRQCAQDGRIRLIGLSRNFGHQIATTAGIDAARGDAVVLIDGDLQDPPEVIHEMIALWQHGYDVIYATRATRAGEAAWKLWSAKIFYRLLSLMSELPIPLDTGDFRLMSRPVVDALRAMPECDRFLRGMVSWIGFKQIALPYQRAARFAGRPKYSIRKLVKLASDGLLSFSTRPLQLSVALGLCSAGVAVLGILYALGTRLMTNEWIAGWTSLVIAVLFMGGVQLICVGILGEYVGRIYAEVKQRPLYLVQETSGSGVAGSSEAHPLASIPVASGT